MKRSFNYTQRLVRNRKKAITDASRTIRALRLLTGLSRRDAGRLLGVTARAFEQIENGRCFMRSARIENYVRGLGYYMSDFHTTRPKAREVILEVEKRLAERARLPQKPRRNLQKMITKETRVIRILRKLTQYQAVAASGYANSIFCQIENGRIELPRQRIERRECDEQSKS